MTRVARFGLAGGLGSAVDFCVLMAMLWLGLGPWWGRAVSFWAAASTTYFANATYTFEARDRIGPRNFALYVSASLGAFTLNAATYSGLVYIGVHPVAALAVASLCGMTLNYLAYARIF